MRSHWSLASLSVVMLAASGCGSTGTEASGSGENPPAPFCTQFAVGSGLICDSTTTPPTLRVDYGTAPGTVAEGSVVNPNKGKFLGVFTPTINQANPPILAAPGGLMTGRGGGITFNPATGSAGVRAGNEICSTITDFAGKTAAVASGHACSMEELIQNAHAGTLPVGANGRAFSSIPYARAPTGTDPAISNFKNSCGNWTYDSQDLGYTPTTWTVVEQNDKALFGAGKAITIKFVSNTTVPSCAAALPIACCE